MKPDGGCARAGEYQTDLAKKLSLGHSGKHHTTILAHHLYHTPVDEEHLERGGGTERGRNEGREGCRERCKIQGLSDYLNRKPTSLPMSPFLTMYSLLRKSLGLMERASSFVNPISVFWNNGTCKCLCKHIATMGAIIYTQCRNCVLSWCT